MYEFSYSIKYSWQETQPRYIDNLSSCLGSQKEVISGKNLIMVPTNNGTHHGVQNEIQYRVG